MHIAYPTPTVRRLIDTRHTRELFNRIMAAHTGEGWFVALFGDAGVGKTCAARWCIEKLTQDVAARAANSFRGEYVEIPQLTPGNKAKQAMMAVYTPIVARLTPMRSRRLTLQDLARDIVAQLKVTNTQWLFLDEAGRLIDETMDAMVYLLNEASTMGHPLTIVFVGMHGLPHLIEALPQTKSRVAETIMFQRYTEKEAADFLDRVSDPFARLEVGSAARADALATILDLSGGLPREMVQLIARAANMAALGGKPLSAAVIKAAATMKSVDHDRAKRLSDGDSPQRAGRRIS